MQSAHYAPPLSEQNTVGYHRSRQLLDRRCRCVRYNPQERGCQPDAKYLPEQGATKTQVFEMVYYSVLHTLARRAEGLLERVGGGCMPGAQKQRFSGEPALFGAVTAGIIIARTTRACNVPSDGYDEMSILSECVTFRSSCLSLNVSRRAPVRAKH